MDINELRMKVEKSKQINAMKQRIRKEIKTHRDYLENRQHENRELFKPIITTQNEVKNVIDEKQDKLINQLENNQKELIRSVNTLSTVMSNQSSTAGVEKWVSDSPSIYEPIEEGDEEGDEKGDDDNSLFFSDDTEVIKKYGFVPTLKNIPTEKDVRSKIFSVNVKSRSKNPVTKKVALNDLEVLYSCKSEKQRQRRP